MNMKIVGAYLIPSSKTPLVEGYVTMMAAKSLLCFSTWQNITRVKVLFIDIKNG